MPYLVDASPFQPTVLLAGSNAFLIAEDDQSSGSVAKACLGNEGL
jgi:hypothetical protein